ncbi:glyoxylate/hydroxypyruvate reductase A [Roseococcus sp. SYP-B2431]|uniref:2-hydroxyacid dehydrogenase n=1 Tax=Roseococcus sp. SYP-B2431 TaxID=2496640 RepID=UPI00103C8066|nr:glyoxylate/hydroxypyruvate reductase A [Roseococcus sp. SYP-B2431]TCI00303.1 glyoxylate/hydroxypyruvate reductase A [Roseococcus sp. SYP-B2431]
MTALVFHSDFDDADAWEAALKAQLPELDFRRGGDPTGVVAALVWKPPAGFFAPYRDLKLVINLGAGVDSLVRREDLPALPLSRLNDTGMVQLMASYVTHAVTHYARDFHLMERNRLKRGWEYIHPRALSSHRVSVMGLGELGGAAAAALAGMGYDVTGWARSAKNIPGVRCLWGADGFAQALRDADTMVLMLPLTPDTTGVIDAAALSSMKPGANLINVGRSGLVVAEALIAALRDGRIAEATLDVFDEEPLPASHPFWGMENVRITPHIASITVPEGAAPDVAESIRRVLRGEAPLHQVDPARGY